MNNVKSYTDKQLLDRVAEVGGVIPPRGKYLIIGVQSQEDAANLFDDKFYVFDGDKFVMVSSGTTNSGRTGLLAFEKYNQKGVFVWKTDVFYEDLYKRGYHNRNRNGGGMRALRQSKPVYHYRDSDNDLKAEEKGELFHSIAGVNMHGVSYREKSNKKLRYIGGWSVGCMVWNNMIDYQKMIRLVWARNKPVDFCLLKEF